VPDELKLPAGRIPALPPKELSPEALEAWRAEARRALQQQGRLEAVLADSTRTPRGSRFRLLD
jgi:hypothetical protein